MARTTPIRSTLFSIRNFSAVFASLNPPVNNTGRETFFYQFSHVCKITLFPVFGNFNCRLAGIINDADHHVYGLGTPDPVETVVTPITPASCRPPEWPRLRSRHRVPRVVACTIPANVRTRQRLGPSFL